MTRRALAVIITAALVASVPPAHADITRRIETERTERPVGPGVTLSSSRISLNPGERKPLQINGFDARGFSAQIERADLGLSYDRQIIEITPGPMLHSGRSDQSAQPARSLQNPTATPARV